MDLIVLTAERVGKLTKGKELLDKWLSTGQCLLCGLVRENKEDHYCNKCIEDERKEMEQMRAERANKNN